MQFLEVTPMGFSRHHGGFAWRCKWFGFAVAAWSPIPPHFTLGTPILGVVYIKAVDNVRILIGCIEWSIGKFAARLDGRVFFGKSDPAGYAEGMRMMNHEAVIGLTVEQGPDKMDGGVLVGDDDGTK